MSNLSEAIEILKELREQKHHELANCWDFGEQAEKAIDTVLEELNNRIPKEKVENLINTKCYSFVEGNAEFPELATEMKIIRYIKAEDLEGIL